jgi:hypothetical protein
LACELSRYAPFDCFDFEFWCCTKNGKKIEFEQNSKCEHNLKYKEIVKSK